MKNNCRMPLDVQQHFRESVLWTLYQQPTSSNFSSIVSLPFFHDPWCIFCCMRPCKSSYVGRRTVNHRWAKRWASKQWIKSFADSLLLSSSTLQRCRDEVSTWNYPYLHPHPEIRTLFQGDLYWGTTVRAHPNAGWQHQHHTLNSQFRQFLSLMLYMPRTSSL